MIKTGLILVSAVALVAVVLMIQSPAATSLNQNLIGQASLPTTSLPPGAELCDTTKHEHCYWGCINYECVQLAGPGVGTNYCRGSTDYDSCRSFPKGTKYNPPGTIELDDFLCWVVVSGAGVAADALLPGSGFVVDLICDALNVNPPKPFP